MKKIMCLLCLGFLGLALTGCVKINVDMDIKKNKSMDFSMIYAINTVYFEEATNEENDIFNKGDMQKFEEHGFSLELYDDGSMKGYKLFKHIKNIDAVSSKEDVIYNFEDEDSIDGPMFKVKKGLFKNTYTAHFSGADINDLQDSFNNRDDNYVHPDKAEDYNNDMAMLLRNSNDDYSDFENMFMANMDLRFSVRLPHKALSHNATTVNEDDKLLVWNLANQNLPSIDFEFELYNMSNIYLLIGIVFMIGAIFVKVFLDKNRKLLKKEVKQSNDNIIPVGEEEVL